MQVFTDLDRIMLQVHSASTPSGLSRAFELVAKEWRADSIGLVLKPVRMHKNILLQMKGIGKDTSPPSWLVSTLAAMEADNLDANFTGILMVCIYNIPLSCRSSRTSNAENVSFSPSPQSCELLFSKQNNFFLGRDTLIQNMVLNNENK